MSWFDARAAFEPNPLPGCPALLRWWSGLLAANPCMRGVQNKFFEPEPHRPDPFLVYGEPPRVSETVPDLWVFWAENQGVITRFCESDGEDPAVWAKSDFRPTYTDCFLREHEPLSGQLIQWTLLEALYGAPVGGQWGTLGRRAFDGAIAAAKLVQLPLRATGTPSDSMVFYAGEGVIAAAAPTDWPDDVSVIIGARSESPLACLDEWIDDPYAFGMA